MKIRELTGRNINGTEHERNDGMTEVTEITEQRNGWVWENELGEIIHNSDTSWKKKKPKEWFATRMTPSRMCQWLPSGIILATPTPRQATNHSTPDEPKRLVWCSYYRVCPRLFTTWKPDKPTRSLFGSSESGVLFGKFLLSTQGDTARQADMAYLVSLSLVMNTTRGHPRVSFRWPAPVLLVVPATGSTRTYRYMFQYLCQCVDSGTKHIYIVMVNILQILYN
jgi:hypothetical protein